MARRIALCLICTGKYARFFGPCIESARNFFCAGHDVAYFVFSDNPAPGGDISWLPIQHEPWPGPTLHRYHTMLKMEQQLLERDYVYYLDVDMLFVRPVGEEIFGELVATIHPGFCESPRSAFTYETRPKSKACVRANEGTRYYCGAFQGGRSARYVEAMRTMRGMIDADAAVGVVSRWHDESVWNRYLIDHPPTWALSHEYCCPPGWRPDSRKIVIVNKNNRMMRT